MLEISMLIPATENAQNAAISSAYCDCGDSRRDDTVNIYPVKLMRRCAIIEYLSLPVWKYSVPRTSPVRNAYGKTVLEYWTSANESAENPKIKKALEFFKVIKAFKSFL